MAHPLSNARKPVEPGVRVDAAGALAYAGHRVDDPNRLHEFQMLVAALTFNAKAERRAVAPRKVSAVEAVGKDRLRMLDFEEIVSLVPAIVSVDDHVTRSGSPPTPVDNEAQNPNFLAAMPARYITYDTLIAQTLESYADYLETNKRLSELAKLIDSI